MVRCDGQLQRPVYRREPPIISTHDVKGVHARVAGQVVGLGQEADVLREGVGGWVGTETGSDLPRMFLLLLLPTLFHPPPSSLPPPRRTDSLMVPRGLSCRKDLK